MADQKDDKSDADLDRTSTELVKKDDDDKEKEELKSSDNMNQSTSDKIISNIQEKIGSGLDATGGVLDIITTIKSDIEEEKFDNKLAYCRTCGDKIKDFETFQQNGAKSCKECTSLTSLGILKKNKLIFTTDFWDYIIWSIFFSPIIWIWIPLIDDSPVLYLTTIIIYVLIASFLLIIFIKYLLKNKILPLHTIPLGLIPIDYYTYIMFISTIISNILLIIETLRFYFKSDKNIIYECNNIYTYVVSMSSDVIGTTLSPIEDEDDEYPGYCLIYTQLLSNAMVIFISSILINLIIMREVKYNAQMSFKELKKEEIPDSHTTYQFYNLLEKRYYAIHKFKTSHVPTLKMFWKRYDQYSTQWWRSIVIVLIVAAFCMMISCNGFYIFGDSLTNKLKNQPIQWIPVIISILTSFLMFALLFVGFYELSWVFNKAFAVMSVCTPPLKDASKLYQDMTVKYEIEYDDNGDIIDAINRSKSITPTSKSLYREQDININDIKIWWDLRSYGFRTLPLFYEISEPIMTTLTLSVVGLTIFWLYELYVTFDNDVETLKLTISHDPIRFNIAIITGFGIFQLLYTLKYFLKPYSELSDQIEIASKQVLSIKFEIVNEQKNSKRKGYLKECIGLYGSLISEMKNEKATKAPHILGIKVTNSKLKALQSYIISFIVLFVGSVWESWFNAAHTLSE